MAVVSVAPHDDKGSGSVSGADRTFTRSWIVKTNDRADGPKVAMFAAGLPAEGAVYTTLADCNDVDSIAIASRRSASWTGSYAINGTTFGDVWKVDIEFATQKLDVKNINQDEEAPQDRPSVYRINTTKFQRVFYKDRDGNLLTNSAGDLLQEEDLLGDDSRIAVTVTRNELAFGTILTNIEAYRDSLNSANFTLLGSTIATKKAKMQSIEAVENYHIATRYWTVTYSLELNPDTWDEQALDQGFRYLHAANDRRWIFDKDEQGNLFPTREPKALNGSGGLWVSGAYSYRNVNKYKLANFATLAL